MATSAMHQFSTTLTDVTRKSADLAGTLWSRAAHSRCAAPDASRLIKGTRHLSPCRPRGASKDMEEFAS
jgi:hypothetical protein